MFYLHALKYGTLLLFEPTFSIWLKLSNKHIISSQYDDDVNVKFMIGSIDKDSSVCTSLAHAVNRKQRQAAVGHT